MTDILKEIKQERNRQNEKWGEQNHHPFYFLAILGEEVGEANKAAVEAHGQGADWIEYRKELIQVAAVAIQMIESFDRIQKLLGEQQMNEEFNIRFAKHHASFIEKLNAYKKSKNIVPK